MNGFERAMNDLMVFITLAGTALSLLLGGALLIGGLYEVSPTATGHVRLNRITGAMMVCEGASCKQTTTAPVRYWNPKTGKLQDTPPTRAELEAEARRRGLIE